MTDSTLDAKLEDQTEPKSILKKDDTKKKRTRIVWDEDNLATNESEKSATMKIDEPDTPFNPAKYDDEGEENGTTSGKKLAWDKLEEALSKAKEQEEVAGEELPPTKDEVRKVDFEKHRKEHYQEFLTKKMLEDQTQQMEDISQQTKDE
ncbi:protein phosphatase inhibitor 2 [Planoprotostelium fungivorum]|uniref:Protein phosphatase inhibitor 2 n=1 Tax=Planoprotostelium fungivorum TaxID=1890364 RepID=A0A2P6N6P8_9EUKA|nr:protein phosphatase inhibitor 2 [Planoprotostelium fungivorum]